MTSPDPVPLPLGPLAAIVTTDGITCSATEVTGQALAVDEDAELTGPTLEPDDCVAPTMMPPTTPPTTSAAPTAAPTSHRRGLRGCPDSLTTVPGFRPGGSDHRNELSGAPVRYPAGSSPPPTASHPATGRSQQGRIHRGPWPWPP